MKPNFALKLSNDGIELLHRDPSGWLSLGSVSFDNDDVQAGCARLVAEASRLEPGGIRTKLVLPESQLRYATVSAPGPTDEARRYQIEAEIESLTPYAIDEVIYDWSVEDDHAMVVICARDTLAEAESFADASGFNPVAFVAAPESGQFSGEPSFGVTLVSKSYVPSGDRVQFDLEPVRVAGTVRRPLEVPKPTEAVPAAVEPVTKAAAAMPNSVPAAAVARPAPKMPAATGSAPRAPAVAPAPLAERPKVEAPPRPIAPATASVTMPAKPAATSEPLAKVGNLVRRMGTRLRREQAQDDTPAAAQAMVPPIARPVEADPEMSKLSADVPQAASTTNVVRPAASAVVPPSATANADDPATPVSFASRRRPAPVVAASSDVAVSTASNPGGRIAVLPGDAEKSGPTLAKRLKWRFVRAKRAVMSRLPGQDPSDHMGPAQLRQAARAEAQKKRQSEGKAAFGASVQGTPSSRPPISDREKATEAEALTIFGARGNTYAEPSLARRGLMAAGGVMLLLVAVAVWFIYFNNSDQTSQLAQNDTTGVSTTGQIVTPDAVDVTATDIQAPESVAALPDNSGVSSGTIPPAEALADAVEDLALNADAAVEALAAQTDDLGDAVTGAVPTPDDAAAVSADRALDTLVQQALTEALPEEVAPAVTEVVADSGQVAAPTTGQQQTTQDEPFQAADTPQVASTALSTAQRLSLPGGFERPETAEVAFTAPPPPPPFGTEFTFNDNGLVEATRDGALTPSGVTVFARAPSVVPAPRPAGIAPVPVAAPVAVPEPVVEPAPEVIVAPVPVPEPVVEVAPEPAPTPDPVIADDTPREDPALAAARPQPRSARVQAIGEQLAPAAPDPAPEADANAVQQDAAVASPEPETIALETPPPGGVSLAGLRPQNRPTDLVPPEVAAAVEVGTEVASEAVAESLRPNARPGDITERAQAILASAGSSDRGGSSDVETDEGETTASAAPSIPSTASVARAATETNAINLRDINLIGVFGAPQDRRALVRLSSGRVVRLQVGDRLDGGQVTAIGESELRYTKNGRNEILEIGG